MDEYNESCLPVGLEVEGRGVSVEGLIVAYSKFPVVPFVKITAQSLHHNFYSLGHVLMYISFGGKPEIRLFSQRIEEIGVLRRNVT